MDYKYAFKNLVPLSSFDFKIFSSLVLGWDNRARKNDNPTIIYMNSIFQKFRDCFKKALFDFQPYSKEESFIFINAWNEWVDGNHMEPCRQCGKGYLKIVKKEFENL